MSNKTYPDCTLTWVESAERMPSLDEMGNSFLVRLNSYSDIDDKTCVATWSHIGYPCFLRSGVPIGNVSHWAEIKEAPKGYSTDGLGKAIANDLERKLVTLSAGYELDKAVAEACGIEHTLVGPIDIGDDVDYLPPTVALNRPWRAFQPSTDWNDAMLAAKKCGLFYECDLRQSKDACWAIVDRIIAIGRHESGPMAVCLAILAFTKAKSNTKTLDVIPGYQPDEEHWRP